MSVYSAMATAVSGLNAQSRAIGHISDNIANSTTTGYKRVDTSFISMVTTSSKNFHEPGSVIARPQFRNQVQGGIVSSAVPTNVSISGSGYFIVSRPAKIDSTGTATFDPQTLYTRRGDFTVTLDSNGYMVNGAGYYLQGRKVVDQLSRDPVGSPEVIQVDQQTIAAEATSAINYNANLPAGKDVPASAYGNTVSGASLPTFISDSVSGGSVTAYDSLGKPIDIQFRWVHSAEADATTTPATESTWNLYYYDPDSSSATPAPSWNKLTTLGDVTFGSDGLLSSGLTATESFTVDGNTLTGVTIDFGSASTMTQFDSSDSTIQRLDQDGHPLGLLTAVQVDDRGYVVASYDNGVNMTLYQIALAQFANENALDRRDGEAFVETPESGIPQIRAPGEVGAGTVSGSSLENSNVDIADEFTKMIVAQRSYSANSRVITTADEMLQEVINIKR